jgi:hypothetical protein
MIGQDSLLTTQNDEKKIITDDPGTIIRIGNILREKNRCTSRYLSERVSW